MSSGRLIALGCCLAAALAGRARAAGGDDLDAEAADAPMPKPGKGGKASKAPKAAKPAPEPAEPAPEPAAPAPAPYSSSLPEELPPAEADEMKTGEAKGANGGPGPFEPLAGFSEDRAFLRSPGNTFVFFPGFRLDVDGAVFLRQTPKSGVFLRHGRLELAGWLGPFYFDLSGDFASPPPAGADPVAPTTLALADAYLAFAPFGEAMILQAGQFDAPFTMENRTLDMYTDFIDKSLSVRALGVPQLKEVGVMLHGADSHRKLYYAAGVFNGDGPNFRNVDNQVDFIGRAVLAPFAGSPRHAGVRRMAIGASAWYGEHLGGLPLPAQSTPGGFEFLSPRWTTGQAAVPMELHQQGRMLAFAAEANLPLGSRFGLRGEGVFKQQELVEADISRAAEGTITPKGIARLQGISGYGEMYLWLMGDERMLPRPGLELPLRLRSVAAVDAEPPQGVMVAVRGEVLKEDMTGNASVNGNPNIATTRVISGAAVINYWYGRRVRISASYNANLFQGTSESVKAIISNGALEHELLLRFGASL